MKMTKQLVFAFAALSAATMAQARNDVLTLPLDEVVRMGVEQGKLDGSVKFYLSGAKTPKVGGVWVRMFPTRRPTASARTTSPDASGLPSRP